LVGVIEATSQAIDERIGTIGRHIDSEKAPASLLDYLGSWLNLPWHPALEESSKRALLREAGYLLQWRGTTRGLLRLVECISGERAVVAVTDVAEQRALVRLGGKGMMGGPARGLLAGRSRTTATLGGKAVLGRARLGCSTDATGPLDILVPLLIVTIDGDAAIKTANAPYLDDVIAQYAPVGVRHRVRWTANSARNADDLDALVLDAKTPGTLGADSTIGRTVLGGRPRTEIGTGFHMGFQIR
jgi:phage tail-like protein